MHGIVFASLHDFLHARGGRTAVADVFDGRVYPMFQAHPDSDFAELLGRAGEATGLDEEELARDFGAFTGEKTFPRLYPAFYELAPDTCTFLLGVEDRIHELVRATIPDANPPALTVRETGSQSVEIEYTSPRKLCRLLEGLVLGTARWYGEDVQVTETACVKQGAPACLFLVEEARQEGVQR